MQLLSSFHNIFNYNLRINLYFQASLYGFLHLQDKVVEEKRLLPPFVMPTYNHHSPKFIDRISESYLKRCNVHDLGVPYTAADNGSCLFNSVSLSLCGSQEMATELRVRTCIEIVMKKNAITALPIASNLTWVSPNYITSVMDCASQSGWSSIWTIFALAEAIGRPIQSIYLPLNGLNDFSYKFLNLSVIPQNCKDPNDQITVMWTRTTFHDPSKTFVPNHFAPLIKDPPTTAPAMPIIQSYEEFPPLSSTPVSEAVPPKPMMSPIDHIKIPDSTRASYTDSSVQISDNNGSTSPNTSKTSDILETHNIPNSNVLVSGQNLTASQVFDAAMNTSLPTVETIPKGFKDNVYFVFDNSHNIMLRKNSKHSNYSDDCGSWNTHSGRTTKADFIIMPDNSLKWTVQKDGLFCKETQVKGKKTYVPYDPQPKDVVTIHRYYTSLKREKSYKKRVSWFENLPDQFSSRKHIAIVEYSGLCPRQVEPHGNAKNSSQEYVRTDPKVIDNIKSRLQQKQSCADIYEDMVLNDLDNAPRDNHQIRNLKYNEKKKERLGAIGNVADEVIEVMSMVNKVDFVKEVVYTEGNNKPPSFICYTAAQMTDMQQYLKTNPDCILGIDRTFNLGAVYVTNFVYKNTKVIRKETGDHPIFVGPMFLHWEGSFLSYHTFLSHVKARLSEKLKGIDIRIGSDDESGLTKAIDDVFPGITRLLCTKHIKDNISEHLKNKIGINDKDRNCLLSVIFGSNGLVNASDSFEFNYLADDLCSNFPYFENYFNTRLRQRLEDHVLQPKIQLKHERLWTNNNCESINHVFKKAIEWKPQPIPELTVKLMNVVRVQLSDLKRALYGTGNYELIGRYKKYYVSQQSWFSKTQEQQDNLFKKLINDNMLPSPTVKSSCADFEVPRCQRLARKPHQNKRPRTVRTQPRY